MTSTDSNQRHRKPAVDKAHVLNEALPYLQRYAGETIVIKYGGNAMTDPQLQRSFCANVVMMKQVGIDPVVVHGGGPQIGEMLTRMQVESRFIDGMRVTDAATMEVVEMVLGGHVNKEIVSLLGQAGGRALGLTGKDARLIMAAPMQLEGHAADALGYVGEVESIDRRVLDKLRDAGFIPVIAPIGTDASGASYNINADLVASAVASTLGASRLLLLTNTPGILDAQGQLLTGLDADKVRRLIDDGVIHGGMLPKVQCALEAVGRGVPSVVILDGRVEHALLLELFTDEGAGTLIGG